MRRNGGQEAGRPQICPGPMHGVIVLSHPLSTLLPGFSFLHVNLPFFARLGGHLADTRG